MKKTMKALAAVPVLIGMAAAPALAEASLSFSGEMRTRAWVMDYDEADTTSFMDHRLRMYGIFDVAEGVQVHFRTDLSEEEWGSTSSTYGAGRMPGTSMQVDRAFLQLSKNNMQLRAGLQYTGFGPSQAYNSQDEGLQLVIQNDAAPIKLVAVMDGDDEFDNRIEDENWIFGASVSPKMEGLSMDFFGAYFMGTQDGLVDEDRDIFLLGAAVSADAGMARVFGEMNYFGGDYNDTMDVMGLQGYVGADFKVSETVTITPTFMYAQAADADEMQYTVLGNDFNGWDPLFDIGTKLDNEKMGIQRPFDWTGAGAGAIGGSLISKIQVSDVFMLGAGVNYLTVEDDAVVDDDAMGFVAGFSYDIMDNTKLDLQVQYIDLDEGDDTFQGGVYLGVSF